MGGWQNSLYRSVTVCPDLIRCSQWMLAHLVPATRTGSRNVPNSALLNECNNNETVLMFLAISKALPHSPRLASRIPLSYW
jgi:hypothetical protein